MIGDIAEDHAEHRSVRRLLRQTTFAITSTVLRGLLHNKRLTLCALETGWILAFIGSQIPNATMPWWIEQPYQFQIAYFFAASLLLGWIVARIQDQQPLGAVLLFLAPMVGMQVVSDLHYVSIRSEGLRFVAIQFWVAWMPLAISLVPALLRRPTATPTPD
jgi:hypothetical protein